VINAQLEIIAAYLTARSTRRHAPRGRSDNAKAPPGESGANGLAELRGGNLRGPSLNELGVAAGGRVANERPDPRV
jgi:hypothetical protein